MSIPVTVVCSRTAANPVALGPGFATIGAEKSAVADPLWQSAASPLVAILGQLGSPGVLRVGGLSTDTWVWTPAGAGNTNVQIAQVDIAAFATFAKAAGLKVIYEIGLKTNTPSLAAAEATYAAAQLGSALLAFGIGNEPENYSGYSYSSYLTSREAAQSAILAAVPGAKFAGPEAGYSRALTANFAGSGNNLAALTYHYYLGAGSGTVASIVAWPNFYLGDIAALGSSAAAQYGLANGFRISELGTFLSGGSTNTLATGLWVIDALLTIALNGGQGGDVHTWRGDTTSGFSPVVYTASSVTAIQPEFYGIVLAALAANGTIVKTQAISSSTLGAQNAITDTNFAQFPQGPWAIAAPDGASGLSVVPGAGFQGAAALGSGTGGGTVTRPGFGTQKIPVNTGDVVYASCFVDFSANTNTSAAPYLSLFDQAGSQLYSAWGETGYPYNFVGVIQTGITVGSGTTAIQAVCEAYPSVTCASGHQVLFSRPVLVDLTTAAGNLNFSQYAIRRADGGVNVVLVNKDATNTVAATINLGAIAYFGSAPTFNYRTLALTGASLSDTSTVQLGGATISTAGAWSPTYGSGTHDGKTISVNVPPASALLVLADGPGATLTLGL
jgi:hypothetical protein